MTELAAVQHGLVTRGQILTAGVAPRTLTRALDRGLVVRMRREVYRLAGVPATVWQPLMAACLAGAPNAVASHRAAAGLYRLPGIVPGAVEITTTRPARPALAGVACHSTNDLNRNDIGLVRNIPAASPARTVVDLAGQLDRSLLERVVDHAHRRGLLSPTDVEEVLERVGGPGRPGTAVLRSLLDDRLPVDSPLEATWLRRLKRAGLEPTALQHQVVVGRRVLILDFAWPEYRVGMEVDGWDPHRDRSVWDRDHEKANAYAEAGWRVLFVTSRTPPFDVFRQLRRFIVEL